MEFWIFLQICGRLSFEYDFNDILFQKFRNENFDYPNFLSHNSIDLISQILVINSHNRVIFNIKHKYKRNHISITNRKDDY